VEGEGEQVQNRTQHGPQPRDAQTKPNGAGNAALVVQVAIQEFAKLRDEISGRSTSAWTLVGLSITGSAAVAGFVLGDRADPRLLLLLPLLTPSLGMLFIDHAANIGRIGEYINTVIKPVLREATGEHRLLGYEEWVDEFEEQSLDRLLPFGVPLVVAFTIVPVASLAYLAPRLDDAWSWALWGIGCVATATQVYFWYRFLAPPLRRAIARKAS
jgi:hypothetical protein